MNDDLQEITVGEALKRIEEGGKESVTLLKQIESNTKRTTAAMQRQVAATGRVNAKTERQIAINHAQAKSLPARNHKGRFTSEPKEESRPVEQQGKTLFGILKGGAKNSWQEHKGDAKDAAGRATFGAAYDIGKVAVEIAKTAKEKSNQGAAKELKDWAKGTSQKATPQPKQNNQSRAFAQAQQIRTNRPSAGKDGGGSGDIVGNAIGNAAGGLLGKIFAPLGVAITPLVTGFMSLLGPIAAVVSIGAAAYAVGSKLNDGINWLTQKVTGDKSATFGSKAYDFFHGDAASSFESGFGKSPQQAAATISSGQGDAGGKSYGTYQLASKRGEVDSFLGKSGYANQFSRLQVGSKGFDDKWKQMAANDPRFAEAQKQYAVETKYDPQMQKLQKAGVDLSGRGKAVQEMVLSTANQYGANSSTIQSALKGKDLSKMNDAQIVSAVQDYKASNVDQNFKSSSDSVKKGVAQRINDEKGYLLAMANKESLQKKGSSVSSTESTDDVTSSASPKSKQANKSASAPAPADAPATTTTPAPQKAKPAATPVPSLSDIEAKTAAAHPDWSPAQVSMNAKRARQVMLQSGSQPAEAQYKKPAEPQPTQPEPPKIQGVEELTAAAQNMQSAQKQSGSEAKEQTPALLPNIQTDFSDLQLVLMAYDRI